MQYFRKQVSQLVEYFSRHIPPPSTRASDLILEHGLKDAVAVDVLMLVHEERPVFLRKIPQHVHRVLKVAQDPCLPADIVAQPPLEKVNMFSFFTKLHRDILI